MTNQQENASGSQQQQQGNLLGQQLLRQINELIQRITNLENNLPIQDNYEEYTEPTLNLENDADIEQIVTPVQISDISTFEGDPDELVNWVTDVDDLIRMFKPNVNSTADQKNQFYMLCKAIRRKIKGEANRCLVNYNVRYNWYSIKKTLLTYYGEKRDISTLDYQLTNCTQKHRPMEIFYDEINHILSLIVNQIRTDPRFAHPEASKILVEIYNEKALEAFLRGLDGELGRFCKNWKPDSLASAFAYCISFQNTEYRRSMIRPNVIPRNLFSPPIPPRQRNNYLQNTLRPFNYQRNNFRDNNQRHFPQHHNNQNFNQNRPPTPFRQQFNNNNHFRNNFNNNNPFRNHVNNNANNNNNRYDTPEPMDVDRSIQSRQVNYGNRPNSSNYNRPSKRPRVFYTTSDSENSLIQPSASSSSSDNMQAQFNFLG